MWFKPGDFLLTENFIEDLAFFRREFPRLVRFGGFSFGEQAVERPHAAAEDEEFGALFAKAFEFGSFKGRGLAEHPGDDARFDGCVADGVEWGWSVFVHGRLEIGSVLSLLRIPRQDGGGSRRGF